MSTFVESNTNELNLENSTELKDIEASVSPVVKSEKLKKYQHYHSVLFSVLGLSGLIAIITLSLTVAPISTTGIWIFLTSFFFVGMGLTIGYHRYFTHKSFKAHPSIKAALGILGCMAGQGPIVFWVALHRRHHVLSDKEGDPHSPNLSGDGFKGKVKGLFHAYIGWTVKHEVPNANYYARDMLQDPLISFVNRHYYKWIVLGFSLPAIAGGLISGTWYGALEGFLLGGLVRMFALHNVIWWITSFSHVFGQRTYKSNDLSTNNFWLAIPTLGESWHNNHHAFPKAAKLNFVWWQFDISGYVLELLKKLGLVWDLEMPKPSAILKAKRKP